MKNLFVTKIYLNVPYEKKEDAKKYGCRFDYEIKKWYIYSNNPKYEDLIKHFTSNILVDKLEDYLEKLELEELEELEKEFQQIIKTHENRFEY